MSENCNYAPVEKVILIDDRRIEIYWGEQMRRADNENDYLVKYKGEVQELVHWTSDMTWDYGTVYQKESMRTTLSLVHPVDPECAGEVTVQIVGKLTDVKDRPADNEKVYQTAYQAAAELIERLFPGDGRPLLQRDRLGVDFTRVSETAIIRGLIVAPLISCPSECNRFPRKGNGICNLKFLFL